MRIWVFLLAAGLSVCTLVGCNDRIKTGEVVGAHVSLDIGGALAGHPEGLKLGGAVTVRLANGKEVDAACPLDLAPSMKKGQRVQVAVAGDRWTIIGLVEK